MHLGKIPVHRGYRESMLTFKKARCLFSPRLTEPSQYQSLCIKWVSECLVSFYSTQLIENILIAKISYDKDFPGGPVAKMLRSQRGCPGFDPWLGN